MSPRTGRPTDCRKDHDTKVRIDEKTNSRLLEYCKEHGITKAEAIRRGIIALIYDKK